MLGRRLLLCTALLALLCLPAATALADPPAGPRLSFVQWKGKTLWLATVAPNGAGRRNLTGRRIQPTPFDGASWSADGAALVFSGYPPKKGKPAAGKQRLFMQPASGGAPTAIPHTAGASHPVLSADGRTVAFSRSRLVTKFNPKHPLHITQYFSITAWTVRLDGGRPRRLTPWRNGLVNEPASFAPDGAELLLTRRRGSRPSEVVSRRLASGRTRVLARRAEDPAFSPDGSRIALISYRDGEKIQTVDGPRAAGELYVIDANGRRPRRLTHTAEAHESQPSWDPSGDRIAFVRAEGEAELGFGDRLMQVNVDGSCARTVLGSSSRNPLPTEALYGPAWQPGPGRGAGPISC